MLRDQLSALDVSLLALTLPFKLAEAERLAVLARRALTPAQDALEALVVYLEKQDAKTP